MNSEEHEAVVPEDFSATQLIEPGVIANPYPYYEQLRSQSPQFGLLDYPPGTIPGQDEPHPAWVFLRYKDVVEIVRNHDVFSSISRRFPGVSATCHSGWKRNSRSVRIVSCSSSCKATVSS